MPLRPDEFEPARLSGRLANGSERDAGYLCHAVEIGSTWGRALCGAIPGGKASVGWTRERAYQVTCPRCRKKLEKMRAQANDQTS